jgi:hypothetical protein
MKVSGSVIGRPADNNANNGGRTSNISFGQIPTVELRKSAGKLQTSDWNIVEKICTKVFLINEQAVACYFARV